MQVKHHNFLQVRAVSAALALLVILSAGGPALGQSVPVTFTLNPALSSIVAPGLVTGDFFGTGSPVRIPLTPQGNSTIGFGNVTGWGGTLDTTIGFNVPLGTPNSLRLDGGTIDPEVSGDWEPGNWNDATEQFDGPKEAADYGWRVSTFVNSAVRDTNLTATSNTVSVDSNGEFLNAFGLRFTGGWLDILGAAIGAEEHDPIADELRQYEINPNLTQPNGDPYPADLIWREVVGTDVHGNPIYGDLVNAFTEAGEGENPREPVRIFDPDTGEHLRQVFLNNSTNPSTLTVTRSGSNNEILDLALMLDLDATAAFFLGDFLVEFGMEGQLHATAQINVPGDGNLDGDVTGADFTVWTDNFGQNSVTGNSVGDYNNDGQTTGADFTVWTDFFGFGSAAPAPAGALAMAGGEVFATPEPSSLALLVIGSVGALACGGRKRLRDLLAKRV